MTRYISGDITQLIVSHLPVPDLASLSPSALIGLAHASRDLYSVMRVSTSFFYPASEALWSSCGNIQTLLWILYGGLGLDKPSRGMESDVEKRAIDLL